MKRTFLFLTAGTQVAWGAALLAGGSPMMTTSTASQVYTLGWLGAGTMYIGFGVMTSYALIRHLRLSRAAIALLVVPGAVSAMISAGTIMMAMFLGEYADGTFHDSPRPLFVFTDQLRPLLWSMLYAAIITDWMIGNFKHGP